MLEALPSGADASEPHIFAVGFGTNGVCGAWWACALPGLPSSLFIAADLETLRDLANRTNGKYWAATTSTLASVYQQISFEV